MKIKSNFKKIIIFCFIAFLFLILLPSMLGITSKNNTLIEKEAIEQVIEIK